MPALSLCVVASSNAARVHADLPHVEVIADPQAQPGFVEMVPRDGGEPFRAVATPVDFDGHALHVGPVPKLGEHTAEILDELRDLH